MNWTDAVTGADINRSTEAGYETFRYKQKNPNWADERCLHTAMRNAFPDQESFSAHDWRALVENAKDLAKNLRSKKEAA